jgi:hypothetical protein
MLILLQVPVVASASQRSNPDFRKFILKALILTIPLLLGLAFIEYRLSLVAVAYNQKKFELEKQLDQIQVLVLGSSNAHFGINPNQFSYKGFNLSDSAQWPYYDLQLTKKYLHRMPNLKLVIFSISYYTFGTDEALDKTNDWRLYAYMHYYGILPHEHNAPLGLYHPLDPRLFSKIALYGGHINYYLTEGKTDMTKGVIEDDGSGWVDAGVKPCNLDLNIGYSAALGHNASVNPVKFDENLEHISELVELLRHKHIQFVIVELPQHAVYTDHLDAEKLRLMENKIKIFAEKYHVQHVNYLHDKNFTIADYTDMPDHLNKLGANKISKMIDQEIIVPKMKSLAWEFRRNKVPS